MPPQEMRPLWQAEKSPAFLEAVLRESQRQIGGKIEQGRWLVRALLSGENVSFHLPQTIPQTRMMLTNIKRDKGGFVAKLSLPEFDECSARVWDKAVFVPDADYASMDEKASVAAESEKLYAELRTKSLRKLVYMAVGFIVGLVLAECTKTQR